MKKKQCSKCRLLLSRIEFYRAPTKDGKRYRCKSCEYLDVKKYREKNSEKLKLRQKMHYEKNKIEIIKNINLYNKKRDRGLYIKYWTMIARCKYKSQGNYKWYGGKGIKVEWESYDDFKQDMFAAYMRHVKIHGIKNTTIERIDPSKNYSNRNCRWATWEEQHRNKTNSIV